MATFADYKDAFWQCYFIPKPTLTETNLPSQSGRVFIVTGGYAGCGKELSKILYGKGGTVYLAGRSQDKAEVAMEEIRKTWPSSDGRLEFLKVDLADLVRLITHEEVSPLADQFLRDTDERQAGRGRVLEEGTEAGCSDEQRWSGPPLAIRTSRLLIMLISTQAS